MDCKSVRDRFSALLESELRLAEEKKVREHLGSCRNCQKEWEEFNRMMGRLHAFEEEEVPEGFLSEIQKKREERKGQKSRGWIWSLRSMKVPIQAAAMVMIVFFTLYLTKMSPFDMFQKKAVEKPEVLKSEVEKKEPILTEEERQKGTMLPPALYQKEDVSEARSSVADEKVREKNQFVQKRKEGEKKRLVLPLKEERVVAEPVRPKETAKAEPPYGEEKRREQETAVRVMAPHPQRSLREITLKISDRERAIFQVQELARQLGGEVAREDGDVLLASLPASNYAEFEKELIRVGSSPEVLKLMAQKERKDDLKFAAGAVSKESEEKGKELSSPMSLQEETVSIRIHLIPE